MGNLSLDKLIKNLKSVEKEYGNGKNVPVQDLLTGAFMSKHTNYSSLDDFVEASGFDWSTEEAIEAIPDDELDAFVEANTKFSSWQEMLSTASAEHLGRQLGF